MDFPTIEECKNNIESIVRRVVIDENKKDQIIHLIRSNPKILPMKAIMHELENTQTLDLTDQEKETVQDINFIYI
ncbi:hypothetical protein [Marinobacter mangrovi]|uniref:hypothetical protein n=1 Tax=Marinobacter mangrovi TaxID=2803918 RepID=UPI00193292E6|nr:hypothetical protein [Marinobacter mangrovi]